MLAMLSQVPGNPVLVIAMMSLLGCSIAVIDCNPFVICDQLVESKQHRATIISLLDNTMNVAQVLTAVFLGTLVDFLGGVQNVFCFVGLTSSVVILGVQALTSSTRSKGKVT